MRSLILNFIGIDVSKQTFDVDWLVDNRSSQHNVFNNQLNGFKSLLNWVKGNEKNTIYCLEATGIYSVALAKFLYEQGQCVLMVNPIKTHAFAKMKMARNKTDKTDAQLIGQFSQYLWQQDDIETYRYVPKSIDFEQLQAFMTRLDQINKSRTQEKNRLEGTRNKQVILSIKAMIVAYDKQLGLIIKQIKELVETHAEMKAQVALLSTIQGVADKTAWAILGYLGDYRWFQNAKQVSSYVGLNPRIEDSGTSIHRSRVSKMGHHRLRKALYMPALSAANHNPVLKAFYQKLIARGKPKKVALIAVMRKLLVIAYGVLKSEKPFDPHYAKQ